MAEITIVLDSINDIKDFVKLSGMCSGNVTVFGGRYIADGKSIMGVISLDLSNPIKVEIEGDIPETVREGMKKFIFSK